MKKIIKNVAIGSMLGVATLGLMTGCAKNPPEDPKPAPYIKVEGLDVTYVQGEQLNVEGAKILYYSDVDDEIADELNLTSQMVANFSTEEVGEQTMKIIWNIYELEVNYTVISQTDFLNLYSAAYNNIETANAFGMNVDYESVEGDNTRIEHLYSTKIDNKVYTCQKDGEDNILVQTWIQQDEDKWYKYNLDNMIGGEEYKYTRQEFVETPNLGVEATMMMVFSPEDLALQCNRFSYDLEGSTTVLTCYSDAMNAVMKFYIEDGNFVKAVMENSYTYEEVTTYTCYNIDFIYDAEDLVMEGLPVGVSWKDLPNE